MVDVILVLLFVEVQLTYNYNNFMLKVENFIGDDMKNIGMDNVSIILEKNFIKVFVVEIGTLLKKEN